MGYLAEFPHMEANKLNLDWLLEQYSTFNARIKEIQDHFDEVAAEMASEVNQLELDFADFKQTVNNNFSSLSHELQTQVQLEVAEIQRQINLISQNMAEYIEAHMEEWQAEAINIFFNSNDRNYDANSTITCDKTFSEIYEAIENPNYKFKLAYTYTGSPEMVEYIELTNIQRFGDGEGITDYIILEGVKDSHLYTVKYDVDGTLACVNPKLISNQLVSGTYQKSSPLDVDSGNHTASFDGDTGFTIGKGTFLVVAKLSLYSNQNTLEAGIIINAGTDCTAVISALGTTLLEGQEMTVCGIYTGSSDSATIKAQVFAAGTLAANNPFSINAKVIKIK